MPSKSNEVPSNGDSAESIRIFSVFVERNAHAGPDDFVYGELSGRPRTLDELLKVTQQVVEHVLTPAFPNLEFRADQFQSLRPPLCAGAAILVTAQNSKAFDKQARAAAELCRQAIHFLQALSFEAGGQYDLFVDRLQTRDFSEWPTHARQQAMFSLSKAAQRGDVSCQPRDQPRIPIELPKAPLLVRSIGVAKLNAVVTSAGTKPNAIHFSGEPVEGDEAALAAIERQRNFVSTLSPDSEARKLGLCFANATPCRIEIEVLARDDQIETKILRWQPLQPDADITLT